jgi:hypothetical protein
MGAPSNTYRVRFPDGKTDLVTILGPMKRDGAQVTLRGRTWIVISTHIASPEDTERDIRYEIHVRAAED